MIVEIPRGTNAKMEISPGGSLNPIKQDVKNGKLRVVDDVYPYTGYIWNYGAFPQTWENPLHKHADTGYGGDNDPIDVCEIGSAVATRGQIKQVKVLGSIALIDEGETDWKVIAIDVNDPRAGEFNDIDDVQRLLPGFTMATYEWFRTYKIPAGKPPNEFAFNGEAKNKEYTFGVIAENQSHWKKLITGEIPKKTEKYDIDTTNFTVEGSPYKADYFEPALTEAQFVDRSVKDRVPDANPVKDHVELQQRAHPFGTAELSTVVSSLAIAAYRGAAGGEQVLVDFLSNVNLAGLYSASSSDPIVSKGGQYSVYYYVKENLAVFGVYQKSTPHRILFSEADAVTAAGYDLVAAAYAYSGKFTYTARYGTYTFNENGVVETDPIPDVASDSLLAVKAPLAFFR